jgi:hypothetical protein
MADPRYNSIHNWLDSRFSQVDIGDGTNQFSVSSTGTLSLSGSATGWDDLRFPFTATKLGALDKPDFDATNVGLLFPVNDATEIIYIIAQMPHEYKEGSRIYPHLHWQQMNGNNVVWKAAYKWFNKGWSGSCRFHHYFRRLKRQPVHVRLREPPPDDAHADRGSRRHRKEYLFDASFQGLPRRSC